MCTKNVKKIDWWQVIWVLSTQCDDYRFLLTLVCKYWKDHIKVKSLKRVSYYVLRNNYSTTFMYQLAFCAENIDEFLEWKKEYSKD